MAAAQAAAGRSAARDAGKVEVDYTPRKYVRRIGGGAPGRVTYRNERTVAVAPAEDDPKRKSSPPAPGTD